ERRAAPGSSCASAPIRSGSRPACAAASCCSTRPTAAWCANASCTTGAGWPTSRSPPTAARSRPRATTAGSGCGTSRSWANRRRWPRSDDARHRAGRRNGGALEEDATVRFASATRSVRRLEPDLPVHGRQTHAPVAAAADLALELPLADAAGHGEREIGKDVAVQRRRRDRGVDVARTHHGDRAVHGLELELVVE